MAAQVLGRAVDHEVGAELDRLLQIGRREGVVHGQQGPGLVGQLGDGGDVEDLQERIGRRLDPDEFRVLGVIRSWRSRRGWRRRCNG